MDNPPSPPWKTVKEPELRAFLLDRAREGFSFPLNPVWPVRDPGWMEVLHALQQQGEAAANLQAWFPPSDGIVQRIEKLHAEFPRGFTVSEDAPKVVKVKSVYKNFADVETCDLENLGDLEVRLETRARWRRIKLAVKMQMLSNKAAEPPATAGAPAPTKDAPQKSPPASKARKKRIWFVPGRTRVAKT